MVESYRRIRNTLRFLLANTADFDPAKHLLPVAEWVEIDRYALAMTRAMAEACAADYAKFEFHLVAQRLQTFCSEDLGGFWLDILKDRLYTTAKRLAGARSAQSALHHVTHVLLRLMAPILSFTAEEAGEVLIPARTRAFSFPPGRRCCRRRKARKSCAALGAHPRDPRLGDQAARGKPHGRRDRLVAAGGSDRRRRAPTCSRRSLADDAKFVFITSCRRARRHGRRSQEGRPERRAQVSAAGTGATTWAPTAAATPRSAPAA